MELRDSAFAIILHSDHILLVKARDKSHWQLPGGRLESGESSVDAVVREVREETGLRAEVVRLTGRYRREDGTMARVYCARARGRLSGARREIIAQRWVPIREAKDMVGHTTRRRLVEGLSQIVASDKGATG
jgi:8-oxo-dGTP pyrophosphatase MutT (NUDIX family)